MGADDFMQRMEMALYALGFTRDNSIGEQGSWLASLHILFHHSQSVNLLPLSKGLGHGQLAMLTGGSLPTPAARAPHSHGELVHNEVTVTLKHRIEETFGSAFSTTA